MTKYSISTLEYLMKMSILPISSHKGPGEEYLVSIMLEERAFQLVSVPVGGICSGLINLYPEDGFTTIIWDILRMHLELKQNQFRSLDGSEN